MTDRNLKTKRTGLQTVAGTIMALLLILPTALTFFANLLLVKWRNRPFGKPKKRNPQ